MREVSPHNLKPGQIFADDVFNFDARLLFAQGTSVDEEKIETLMMWGIESVPIEGGESDYQEEPSRNLSNKARNKAEKTVQKRFKLVKSSHPAVVAIKEIAVLEAARLEQTEKSN